MAETTLPPLSAESARLHAARAIEGGPATLGDDSRLQTVAASALQHRSSVRRAETADALAPRAIAAHVECHRAIPAGGYRPELETDGALPRSAQWSRTQYSLRSKAEPGPKERAREIKSTPSKCL